ncbi:MAG: N-acetylmuramoyl-L-alanine amidase [Cyclobacteriaceae bacterium]|nr:N-acetylmuramoyl-L-alanine amidase [Cyclobacteriaceae bacterium]
MFRACKLITTFLLLSVIQHKSFGQQVELVTMKEVGRKFTQKSAVIEPALSYALKNSNLFTSISIQTNETQSFEGAYLLAENDTFFLTKDEHVEAVNGLINSNLVSFGSPVSTVHFYASKIEHTVLFNFINGSVSQLEKQRVEKEVESGCLDEPVSIDQQVWRSGLQAPQYTRSFSTVKHVIVHHSAGSNSNINYTQVVRDIYIYHTEVNGWSDIGYNYLIAQDGTIFKGRDPETGEQDNVRGAHFCGMNTGTMGVCLLGNYTSITPTDETIQSLLNLISWKLDKEGLNAFESFSFNSISNLGAISGHRDGCSTECPGTKTYQKITNFKSEANLIIETCHPDKLIADFTWSSNKIIEDESVSFTDTSQGVPLLWEWQLEGSDNGKYTQQNPGNVLYPNAGEFDVSLIVRNGSRTDTAVINNLIIVGSNPFNVPAVFPNPVNYKTPLTLNLNKEEVTEVNIINTKGEIILCFVPTINQIKIDHSNFNAGIYFVRFLAGGKVLQSTKIMIVK